MLCTHCESPNIRPLKRPTSLGYLCFQCRECSKTFNERTDTPFNFLEFPTDIVMLVVTWRLRYKLSLRDLTDGSPTEMFLCRGLVFTHEAVRDWEARFASMLTQELRRRRKDSVGESWYVDEMYIKVSGKWCYLYRAIDRDRNLVDCRFSEKRDMDAAKAFFHEVLKVTGVRPDRVTTDGYESYSRAIKSRYKPMRGFQTTESADRFCRAFDELRNFLKADTRTNKLSLAEKRQHHQLQTQRIASWF